MADDLLGAPATSATETPWELAQRLSAQGLPLPVVSERLLQAGLPSEDVATLLRALRMKSVAPPSARGPEQEPNELGALVGLAKAGLAAHALLVHGKGEAGKEALNHLLQATTSFMGAEVDTAQAAVAQPKAAPSDLASEELATFEAPDGSPRCQVHPKLPSVGSCPRCGVLACYTCAPKKGSGGTEFCAACEQQPVVHEARVKKATRRLAVTVFLEAVLLLGFLFFAPLFGTAGSSWGRPVPSEVVLSLAFAALGLAQWFVRHPWPGMVGAVASGGLLLAPLLVSREEVPAEILLLQLVPLVAMLFALERLTTRRKERRLRLGAKGA